jgi:hypothetical protein
VPSVFIDTYYRPDDPNERSAFYAYTGKLLNFAHTTSPFECKDIEIALNEIMEMTNNITVLKSNNAELEKNITEIKNENRQLQVAQEDWIFCINNK